MKCAKQAHEFDSQPLLNERHIVMSKIEQTMMREAALERDVKRKRLRKVV